MAYSSIHVECDDSMPIWYNKHIYEKLYDHICHFFIIELRCKYPGVQKENMRMLVASNSLYCIVICCNITFHTFHYSILYTLKYEHDSHVIVIWPNQSTFMWWIHLYSSGLNHWHRSNNIITCQNFQFWQVCSSDGLSVRLFVCL